MSTLTEIVDGLDDRLRTIAAFDYQVHRVVQRPPTWPAAVIVPPAIPNYGSALSGGGCQFTIPVVVVVGIAETEKQSSLLPFIDWSGASSVPAAVEADQKLGLTDVTARVVSAEQPGVVEFPDGTTAYGVTFNVQIMAS